MRALRDKYERMHVLREAHTRASTDASFVEPDPRASMASLADEFPGALRELDRLPLEEIVARIDALRAAEEDPARVEGWMLAQATFHRFARGALAVKRWLANHPPDEVVLRKELPLMREEAALFATDLEQIAFPPRGRVMDVVRARTAAELGISEAELREILRF